MKRDRTSSYKKKIFFVDVSFSSRMSSRTSSMNDCNTTTSVIVYTKLQYQPTSSSIRYNIISRKAHSVDGNSVNPSSIVLQFTRTPIVKQLKGCVIYIIVSYAEYIFFGGRSSRRLKLACKRPSLFSLHQRAT